MSEQITFFSDKTYVQPKKSLGQHFLLSTDVAQKIVNALDLKPDDVVVELGAGKGILTQYIIGKVKHVIAIELDFRLCRVLEGRFGNDERFTLLNKDILKTSFGQICADLGRSNVKIVGNLPYNITSPIMFKLIDERQHVECAVVMMQLEVAQRLCAPPGRKAYGVPTIITQVYGQPSLLFQVPPKAFKPRPKVQSAVLRLDWHKESPVTISDDKLFFQLVKSVFSQRRKMLRNSLLRLGQVTKDDLQILEEQTSIQFTRRPETLTLNEFASLTSAILNLVSDNDEH